MDTSYTSSERLRLTLDHREPDRIPFDLGGCEVTGINIHALNRLRKLLGLSGEAEVMDRVTQTGETGDDVRDRLGVDVKNVQPLPPSSAGLARDLGLVGDHYRLIDEFGMGRQPRDG